MKKILFLLLVFFELALLNAQSNLIQNSILIGDDLCTDIEQLTTENGFLVFTGRDNSINGYDVTMYRFDLEGQLIEPDPQIVYSGEVRITDFSIVRSAQNIYIVPNKEFQDTHGFQKLDIEGNPVWGLSGKSLNNNFLIETMISDHLGGLYVFWGTDSRRVMVSHLSSEGEVDSQNTVLFNGGDNDFDDVKTLVKSDGKLVMQTFFEYIDHYEDNDTNDSYSYNLMKTVNTNCTLLATNTQIPAQNYASFISLNNDQNILASNCIIKSISNSLTVQWSITISGVIKKLIRIDDNTFYAFSKISQDNIKIYRINSNGEVLSSDSNLNLTNYYNYRFEYSVLNDYMFISVYDYSTRITTFKINLNNNQLTLLNEITFLNNNYYNSSNFHKFTQNKEKMLVLNLEKHDLEKKLWKQSYDFSDNQLHVAEFFGRPINDFIATDLRNPFIINNEVYFSFYNDMYNQFLNFKENILNGQQTFYSLDGVVEATYKTYNNNVLCMTVINQDLYLKLYNADYELLDTIRIGNAQNNFENYNNLKLLNKDNATWFAYRDDGIKVNKIVGDCFEWENSKLIYDYPSDLFSIFDGYVISGNTFKKINEEGEIISIFQVPFVDYTSKLMKIGDYFIIFNTLSENDLYSVNYNVIDGNNGEEINTGTLYSGSIYPNVSPILINNQIYLFMFNNLQYYLSAKKLHFNGNDLEELFSSDYSELLSTDSNNLNRITKFNDKIVLLLSNSDYTNFYANVISPNGEVNNNIKIFQNDFNDDASLVIANCLQISESLLNVYSFYKEACLVSSINVNSLAIDNSLISCTSSVSLYPNPFNPSTNISFNLKKKENVQVFVYNIKGQRVNTIADQNMLPGEKEIVWNGKDYQGKTVSSGIYFIKVKSESVNAIKKAILLK